MCFWTSKKHFYVIPLMVRRAGKDAAVKHEKTCSEDQAREICNYNWCEERENRLTVPSAGKQANGAKRRGIRIA